MRRILVAPLLAAALALSAFIAPVGAVTGGQPDGTAHPQVALLLAPELTFCSGALISNMTILTAGHCTAGWDALRADPDYDFWDGTILVSFDPQAAVDENWVPVDPTQWHEASRWETHPDYVDADWPFTPDYGLLFLDEPVTGIPYATLADPLELQPIIDSNGKSKQQFDTVGYGIQGKTIGNGPPARLITWQRKIAVNRVSPGNGSVNGLFDPTWFILQNVPNQFQGGACGGDSGSPVFWHGTTEIVAVHTGGYRMGYNGVLCGRMTSLNHRVDLPEIRQWIIDNTEWAPVDA